MNVHNNQVQSCDNSESWLRWKGCLFMLGTGGLAYNCLHSLAYSMSWYENNFDTLPMLLRAV